VVNFLQWKLYHRSSCGHNNNVDGGHNVTENNRTFSFPITMTCRCWFTQRAIKSDFTKSTQLSLSWKWWNRGMKAVRESFGVGEVNNKLFRICSIISWHYFESLEGCDSFKIDENNWEAFWVKWRLPKWDFSLRQCLHNPAKIFPCYYYCSSCHHSCSLIVI